MKEAGPKQRLVGLELEADAPVATSRPVIDAGRKVGETVAAFRGLTIQRNLAWALLEAGCSDRGKKVTIALDEKDVPATIVDIRYYDAASQRMRT